MGSWTEPLRCCSPRCTAFSQPGISRRGFSRIDCRSGCSCKRTSTSGTRTRVGSKAILLLSGGLDSYTAGAMVRREGLELYALTVRYGQVHAREVSAARDVAKDLRVAKHVELDVDLA